MSLTYFTGAGASAESVPVISQFNIELEKFQSKIDRELIIKNNYFDVPEMQINKTPLQMKQELLSGFEWLRKESAKFSTIDTFARKLYLTKDEKYPLLKSLLSFFLTSIQTNEANDYRYDNLLAALLGLKDGKVIFPNDLSIITWNYDVQPEIAAAKFLNKKVNLNLNVDLQSSVIVDVIEEDKYKILKLNGTAGFYRSKDKVTFDSEIINNESSKDPFDRELFNFLLRTNGDVETMLYFSWENIGVVEYARKIAREILSRTIDLVIVGYSFPVFNREIDRSLLQEFNRRGTIYIQDRYNSGNIRNIVLELAELRSDQVRVIDSITEFHIPLNYSPVY